MVRLDESLILTILFIYLFKERVFESTVLISRRYIPRSYPLRKAANIRITAEPIKPSTIYRGQIFLRLLERRYYYFEL